MRQTPARTSTIRYGTHDASSACKASVSGRATGVSECDDRLALDHCRAHALQACLSLLVIHRRRAVHPVTHERAVTTLDNGLAGALHQVEQVVDVVHRQQNAAEHLLLRDHVTDERAAVAARAHRAGAGGVDGAVVAQSARCGS